VTAPPERTDPFAVDADPRWSLRVDGWTSTAEPGIEGALALVNGYAGTRAALEEGSAVSTPATFLNGVFDAASHAAAQAAITPDRQVIAAPTAELVVAPDWSKLRVLVQGEPLTVETATVLGHRRTLDLRRGVLVREWRLRMGGVRHLVDHRTRPLEGGMLLETVTAQRTRSSSTRESPASAHLRVRQSPLATHITYRVVR
jgi:trehalose/maltose hydrolase-like predicted phosphorylase